MKKVLFTCRGNVGRSQMASTLYNSLGVGQSDSAGTRPKRVELTVGDIPQAKNVIIVMRELGLDMSGNTRRLITPEILEDYDIVINMAEPETTPDFMTQSPKVVTWIVTDPAHMNLDDTRKTRDLIFAQVKELAGNLART